MAEDEEPAAISSNTATMEFSALTQNRIFCSLCDAVWWNFTHGTSSFWDGGQNCAAASYSILYPLLSTSSVHLIWTWGRSCVTTLTLALKRNSFLIHWSFIMRFRSYLNSDSMSNCSSVTFLSTFAVTSSICIPQSSRKEASTSSRFLLMFIFSPLHMNCK